MNKEGLGNKWGSFRTAEVGHVVGEANYAWDVGRIGT